MANLPVLGLASSRTTNGGGPLSWNVRQLACKKLACKNRANRPGVSFLTTAKAPPGAEQG
jgi:hypothetical protein